MKPQEHWDKLPPVSTIVTSTGFQHCITQFHIFKCANYVRTWLFWSQRAAGIQTASKQHHEDHVLQADNCLLLEGLGMYPPEIWHRYPKIIICDAGATFSKAHHFWYTVGGRNPAPPGMYKTLKIMRTILIGDRRISEPSKGCEISRDGREVCLFFQRDPFKRQKDTSSWWSFLVHGLPLSQHLVGSWS